MRNATELLEKLGMNDTVVNDGAAGWTLDFPTSPGKKLGKKPHLSSQRKM